MALIIEERMLSQANALQVYCTTGLCFIYGGRSPGDINSNAKVVPKSQ